VDASAKQARETADYSLSLPVKHSVSSLGDSFRRKITNSIRASASNEARAVLNPANDLFGSAYLGNLISREIRATPPPRSAINPLALAFPACPTRSRFPPEKWKRKEEQEKQCPPSFPILVTVTRFLTLIAADRIPEITCLDSGSTDRQGAQNYGLLARSGINVPSRFSER